MKSLIAKVEGKMGTGLGAVLREKDLRAIVAALKAKGKKR